MAAYSIISDGDLFSLLKGGNERAYEEIYKRFWAVLYRHARRLLHDDDGAEDVVQEVFLTLWNKAPELEIKGSLSGYLYTTVRNKIFDQIAHGKVKAKYMASLRDFIMEGDCQTDYLIREKQLRVMIEAEIALLPEGMRKAFELSRNSNMSYREIAEELGVSENVVRNQISRALKVLRTRFGDLAVLYFILNH